MSKLEAIKALASANPVDVVAAIVDAVGANSNDAKAKAEFADLVEDTVHELHKKWKDFEDRQRPTASDVTKGLAKLADAYHRANTHKKRKLLWNAFWSTFKPEFYNEGVGNILWEKVEGLEYPDVLFLGKVLEKTDPQKRNSLYQESVHSGGRGSWHGDQLPVHQSDEESEYADRLRQHGLVEIEHSDTRGMLLVSWIGLAKKLRAFALEEWWKDSE